ncbi:hypothetical protein HGP13_19135 [Mesorhizobium sp. NZP2077]|nr:hypothetical protein HGP13_19135 [Mesorhizobium sp. NZP2077]
MLLSLEPGAQEASFKIHKGVEMGRPSLLHVDARRTPEGIVATLRGSCVAVSCMARSNYDRVMDGAGGARRDAFLATANGTETALRY